MAGHASTEMLFPSTTDSIQLTAAQPPVAGNQPLAYKNTPTPAAPQTSYAQEMFVGPFMIGQALKANQITSIGSPVLFGSLVNVSVTGYLINMLLQRPRPLDPFGPFVSFVSQVTAGMLITPAQVKQ